MPCSLTGSARIDPIVDFGTVGRHLHNIHGGQSISFTSGFEEMQASKCSSCKVKEDRSAYWAPALLFKHADGKTEPVSIVGDLLVYYLLFGENIQAFPPGFKLLAGDKGLRNFPWPVPDPPKTEWSGDQLGQLALTQKAIGYNCLNYDRTPEPTLYRHFLPDKGFLDANCKDGLRLELMFPSCWNGKDLDSHNHRDHMAYPDHVIDGNCPPGYEARLPSLLFETIYDTDAFKGKEGSFILANGDPTGYGYHGDFLSGWDPDFLQSAVNTCTSPSGKLEDCPVFSLQSDEDCHNCKLSVPAELENDNCGTLRDGICGNVPLQPGPEYAYDEEAPPVYGPALQLQPQPMPQPQQPPALAPQPAEEATTPSSPTPGPGPAAVGGEEIKAQIAVDPVPTPPPAPLVEQSSKGRVLSTSYSTNGLTVHEIVIEVVETTITKDICTTTTPNHAEEHLRMHQHSHQRRI